MLNGGHLNFCRILQNDSVPLLTRQNLLKDLFAKDLNLPGGIREGIFFSSLWPQWTEPMPPRPLCRTMAWPLVD